MLPEILIDLYKIKNIYSGLGQFSLNFAEEIINKNVNFNLNFLIPSVKNIDNLQLKKSNLINANFQKRYFPNFNKKFNIWHSLNQFPSHFPAKNSKQIITVHDLNFLIEKNEKKKTKYLKRLQHNINKADYITAISNYTKSILEKNIDLKTKKVKVIYNGVKINCTENPLKPDYIGGYKFFFMIGIFNEKKNFHSIFNLLQQYSDFKIIIAGDNNTVYGEFIKKLISSANLSDKVILVGKINENDKCWFYKNCEALLFPSLAEGFGLPVIEAMMFGKPVFLSRNTCLPEIGGELAFYFDNFKAEHIISSVKNGLGIYNVRKAEYSEQLKEYAKKFNWQTCINSYIELYNEVMEIH